MANRQPWITANPIDDRQSLPNEPACYAVYFIDYEERRTLVYVGSTANLRARMGSHGFNYHRYSNRIKTRWHDDVAQLYIKYKLSSEYGDWAMLELKLIMRLRPMFNRKKR